MNVLAELRRDHANVSRMLRVTARELDELEAGRQPDYELLEDVMRYITGYSDIHHHPAEDVVYSALKKHSAAFASTVDSIVAEHDDILELGREFLRVVESVEDEVMIRRDQLVAMGRHYLETLAKHMRTEESVLFPLANESLDAQEWIEIEALVARPPDPLFGAAVEQDYENLWHRIQAHAD